MTTLSRYAGLDELSQRIADVRRRRRAIDSLTGLLVVACVTCCVLLVAGAAAGYWTDQPPRALRWALLLAGSAAVLGTAAWFILRQLARTSLASAARQIELAMPEVGNDLINSLLLAADDAQPSPELVSKAIDEAVTRSRSIDLHRSIPLTPLRRSGIACAVAALLLGGFAVLQPLPLRRGLAAVLAPRDFVPHANTIRLAWLEPGDTTVFAGQMVTIAARVENHAGRELLGEVWFEGAGAGEPMLASGGYASFSLSPRRAERTFRYNVRIGQNRWPADREFYTVRVIERVGVEGLDLEYEYPAYTALPPRHVENSDGAIEAPVGSRVHVTLRLDGPLPAAVVEVSDRPLERMTAGPGHRFGATIPVDADGRWRILLKDETGRTLQQIPEAHAQTAAGMPGNGSDLLTGAMRIRAIPDTPPRVELLSPGRDVTMPPGGRLDVRLRAWDDHGLHRVALLWEQEGADRRGVHEFAQAAGRRETPALTHSLDLRDLVEGDVLVYHALAVDNRELPGVAGAQTTRSERFRVVIQDAERVAAEKAQRMDELRRALMAILEQQVRLRTDTEICRRRHERLSEVQHTGESIRSGQGRIRGDLLALVSTFPFDQDTLTVQQACALLANNEADLAIAQAQVLASAGSMADVPPAADLLAGTQDRIIETLQTLLAYLPGLHRRQEARDADEATEAFHDALEQHRLLREQLTEFIAEQRRIIEATDRLSKPPLDDFQTETLRADLIARQDEWERFLNDAIADFSKLAEQDFANPSLLRELLSIKCDVTMARDALAKQADEIATAAEDSGVENARRLTANIEKWLPDEPDRTQWAMEAPEGQNNVEFPELPTELEDLMGDLLEQEEDLFDEIEDVTSNAFGSGDEGIGWDAMDGPISNVGAQGVTGNQLPNEMELAGRSGEGRQGRSAGEMVQDDATGRGGRRTPTRLTPEPFQAGEINDQSDEPAGGATGGGKISGAGGEGLEGPLPPPLMRELERLAGRQASLINQAERIRAGMRPDDYSSFQLLQAITLMNRVQDDLENYRYRNALRQRDEVAHALTQSRLLLAGQISVTVDTSDQMPKYIRDDIEDARRGPLPAEFRDALEQYYRRLAAPPGE